MFIEELKKEVEENFSQKNCEYLLPFSREDEEMETFISNYCEKAQEQKLISDFTICSKDFDSPGYSVGYIFVACLEKGELKDITFEWEIC